MRTGHQGVRARRDRVGRKLRVEAEIGGPGLVDDQRHPGLVRGPGVAGQVAGGADVRRVAEDHAAGVRVRGQRVPDRLHRHRAGQAGARVDLRPHPDRPQARQHQAEQQRPVQRPGDDHLLARLAESQAERLVAVGRPGHGEPAPVGTPQRGRALLGVDAQPVGVLDGGERTVERRVPPVHRARQVLALLVARRGHRGQPPGLDQAHPVQPRGQQRGVCGQAERVAWIVRLRIALDHLSSVRQNHPHRSPATARAANHRNATSRWPGQQRCHIAVGVRDGIGAPRPGPPLAGTVPGQGRLRRLRLAAAPADQGRADDDGTRGGRRDRPAALGVAAASRAVPGRHGPRPGGAGAAARPPRRPGPSSRRPSPGPGPARPPGRPALPRCRRDVPGSVRSPAEFLFPVPSSMHPFLRFFCKFSQHRLTAPWIGTGEPGSRIAAASDDRARSIRASRVVTDSHHAASWLFAVW